MSKKSKGAAADEGTSTEPVAPTQPTENVNGSPVSGDTTPAVDSGDAKAPDDVLSGIAAMPDVQEHAIEAAKEEDEARTAAVEKTASGKVDRLGRSFDPNLHETDIATGEPRLSEKGFLRIKRGNAFKGSGSAKSSFTAPRGAGGSGPTPAGNGPTGQVELEAKISATAQVTAETVFTVGMLLGGEEWQPIKDKETGKDERATMVGAWATYYRAHGITEIPAWVTLSMVMGAYAVPRFFMPKTKTRIQKAKEWFYAFVGRRKAKGGFWSVFRRGPKMAETMTPEEVDETVSAGVRDAEFESGTIGKNGHG